MLKTITILLFCFVGAIADDCGNCCAQCAPVDCPGGPQCQDNHAPAISKADGPVPDCFPDPGGDNCW